MKVVIVLFIVAATVSCSSAGEPDDLVNSYVDWEIFPDNTAGPVLPSDAIDRLEHVSDDKLIEWLSDPQRFALAHVCLHHRKSIQPHISHRVSETGFYLIYSQLHVQVEFSRNEFGIKKSISFPHRAGLVDDFWTRSITHPLFNRTGGSQPKHGEANQDEIDALLATARECELSWAVSKFSEPFPAGIEKLKDKLGSIAFTPDMIDELLADDATLVKFHLALSDVYTPNSVWGYGPGYGWHKLYNGLTVNSTVVDESGNSQSPVISFPFIRTEKHRVRIFWMSFFERNADK
jgi:hypothetical protein